MENNPWYSPFIIIMSHFPRLTVQNFGSLSVIMVDNTDLTKDKIFTYLSEDVISGESTIRVQNLSGIYGYGLDSTGRVLCIGEIGQEKTEIIDTSVTESPSETYNEIPLRTDLKFDHHQGTKVYVVDWNKIEISYASSPTGTKSTLIDLLLIQPDSKNTIYRDYNPDSQVFYFVRFVEDITNGSTRYSNYSDPVFWKGYDDNTVYSIKKRALESLGEEVDGKIITNEFLNEALWEARREYHEAPGKRPFRRKFNTIIGTALTGSYRIELPFDVERPYTAENIFGVRIGTSKNLEYYDKKEWDFDYRNKPHTTLTAAYTKNVSKDLYVANARDFAQSGAVSIEGTIIEYSAKSNSGGTLRISKHGDWDCSAGSDVWQNASYGLPDKFTVWADPKGSAYIYFNRPIETAYTGQNIYCDYYRTLVGYDSDGDKLDEPDYDMYIHYLMAKIKHRKKIGEGDITQDPDYKIWQFKKQTALDKEYLSTQLRIQPDIDHLPLPE